MSTDFQAARAALGARLRDLRVSAPGGRLTGTQLADRLGWVHSKVYKLENGRQTATAEDLRAWAEATGQPGATEELHARLGGLESHVRSWRRQLASGHRPVQDAITAEHARTTTLRVWENCLVAGMLQTPDYARAVFTRHADLMQSPRDTEDAVRERVRRQEALYDSGKRHQIMMWEGALRALVCPPPVLAAQLDRLLSVIGLDTVELGIVPFTAPLKIHPANGFWIYDERLVIVEDWHAELWIDDAGSIATYLRVWNTLRESAVYGADAQRVIGEARRAL
ncbi:MULTISPECIES: helix-turn-helix domain-containing protein [unclassified Streptomyces]|uniref:helix-turn-helix domain-containing protein n=1 Tax=unclassified Streptomyces TaxID=2593676 RepID=UPI0006B22DA8|nr:MULTISPECIES: helix-turn-helix transcriptional regulator [unclassified Streptomyces]KOY57980.1 DNA-binding protein [Streptomyces sp. XY332]TDU76477.1 helix-turn-helix protein [Streptomyces sp. KS 21]